MLSCTYVEMTAIFNLKHLTLDMLDMLAYLTFLGAFQMRIIRYEAYEILK
jgi:hypothetical protein